MAKIMIATLLTFVLSYDILDTEDYSKKVLVIHYDDRADDRLIIKTEDLKKTDNIAAAVLKIETLRKAK